MSNPDRSAFDSQLAEEIKIISSLFKQGAYPDIEARARDLTSRYPAHGFGWKALGASLKQQGRVAEALAAMEKAAALLPHDAETRNNLAVILKDLGRLEEAEGHYRRALELKPGYIEVIANLGNLLLALGRPEEAVVTFRSSLDVGIAPEDASSAVDLHTGLSNALARAVSSWHLPMMNDAPRNEAYHQALQAAVTKESNVLEIGTGSGLLAMMAARLGAHEVITCEAVPLIAATAAEIIADNQLTATVKVIAKKSSDVAVGVDLVQRANLLVSEIFSNELLGEGVLYALEDAKRRLLAPGAKIIPAAASVVFALFESADIMKNMMVEEVLGFDLSRFNALAPDKLSLHRNDLELEFLTEPIEAFTFDFVGRDYFPPEHRVMRVPIKASGRCGGIVQWIRLRMDDSLVFENDPLTKNPASGWQQCIYRLSTPVDVSPGQTAVIVAAHNRKAVWFHLEGLESSAASDRSPPSRSPAPVRANEPVRTTKTSTTSRKPGGGKGAEPRAEDVAALMANVKNGRYAEAESQAREMTQRFPASGFGWKALGAALKLQGRTQESLAPMQRAAEMLPGHCDAHSNLGTVLGELGCWTHAEASYRRALKISPGFFEAHYGLGRSLEDQGRLAEAEASFQRALDIRPNSADAHSSLGSVLKAQNRLAEAEDSYRRALQIRPDHTNSLNGLAALLFAKNDRAAAIDVIMDSLRTSETPQAKILFATCVKHHVFKEIAPEIRTTLTRAVSEPWGRPGGLAACAIHVLKLDPRMAALLTQPASRQLAPPSSAEFMRAVTDPLLRALLASAPICDMEMEQFLTATRRALLQHACDGLEAQTASELVDFATTLANQCFINEYVFAQTDEEAKQAAGLRDSIVDALAAGCEISPLSLMVSASYFPLYAVPGAERLSDRTWSETVMSVVRQQVVEPAEERGYAVTMPKHTVVKDGISLLVQKQYEENPYPRWIKMPSVNDPTDVETYLRRRFPRLQFALPEGSSKADYLIAGCGTGQQSIGAAQSFVNANVLAIDLSMASLCYAKRKTREAGITSIEYAQADILELATLRRTFDVIESSGVLHHLADPFEGWRILLSLLRPGGVMHLGFYSEVARRGIARARAFVADRGYRAEPDDIRRSRQELYAASATSDFGSLFWATDFYTTSTCRDLLFHAQEHDMTLDAIARFLREHGLEFLGFDLEVPILTAYRQRYPEDKAATNLDQWGIVENANPTTFIGMYQFWIQKPA